MQFGLKETGNLYIIQTYFLPQNTIKNRGEGEREEAGEGIQNVKAG